MMYRKYRKTGVLIYNGALQRKELMETCRTYIVGLLGLLSVLNVNCCKYSLLNMIVWTTLGQLGLAPPCGLTMADGDANCVTIWWETHFHTTLVKHCAEHIEIHLNREAPYCAVPVFT